MVKLTDIARELNLDVSVISRALNPNPDKHAVVRQETRELILRTAHRMGYRPNRYASYLKRGKMPTLLCFLPDRADRLIADLAFGISEEALTEGFPVSFFIGNDMGKFIDVLQHPTEIGHAGVISYPPDKRDEPYLLQFLENYAQNGGKALLVNYYTNLPRHWSSVVRLNQDEEAGIALVAAHLLEQRCDRFFTVAEDDWCDLRLQLFRNRMEAAGRPCSHLRLPDIAELLIAREQGHVIGVFAEHDFCALNLFRKLQCCGITPGDTLKVVGYDDQLFAADTHLGLSSVHPPTRSQGRRAVHKLLQLINGKTESDEWIKPELKLRRSSVSPGGAP